MLSLPRRRDLPHRVTRLDQVLCLDVERERGDARLASVPAINFHWLGRVAVPLDAPSEDAEHLEVAADARPFLCRCLVFHALEGAGVRADRRGVGVPSECRCLTDTMPDA